MNEGKRSTCSPIIGTQVVAVRVTPRSGRDALSGWHDGVLRVRLAAAPVDGRANESLVRFLAKILGLPFNAVRLVHGGTGRAKRVAIDGIDPHELRQRLGIPVDAALSRSALE
ncbi:MAG: DUF167 domain-containing protein [Dehalococcoidia bacterium]